MRVRDTLLEIEDLIIFLSELKRKDFGLKIDEDQPLDLSQDHLKGWLKFFDEFSSISEKLIEGKKEIESFVKALERKDLTDEEKIQGEEIKNDLLRLVSRWLYLSKYLLGYLEEFRSEVYKFYEREQKIWWMGTYRQKTGKIPEVEFLEKLFEKVKDIFKKISDISKKLSEIKEEILKVFPKEWLVDLSKYIEDFDNRIRILSGKLEKPVYFSGISTARGFFQLRRSWSLVPPDIYNKLEVLRKKLIRLVTPLKIKNSRFFRTLSQGSLKIERKEDQSEIFGRFTKAIDEKRPSSDYGITSDVFLPGSETNFDDTTALKVDVRELSNLMDNNGNIKEKELRKWEDKIKIWFSSVLKMIFPVQVAELKKEKTEESKEKKEKKKEYIYYLKKGNPYRFNVILPNNFNMRITRGEGSSFDVILAYPANRADIILKKNEGVISREVEEYYKDWPILILSSIVSSIASRITKASPEETPILGLRPKEETDVQRIYRQYFRSGTQSEGITASGNIAPIEIPIGFPLSRMSQEKESEDLEDLKKKLEKINPLFHPLIFPRGTTSPWFPISRPYLGSFLKQVWGDYLKKIDEKIKEIERSLTETTGDYSDKEILSILDTLVFGSSPHVGRVDKALGFGNFLNVPFRYPIRTFLYDTRRRKALLRRYDAPRLLWMTIRHSGLGLGGTKEEILNQIRKEIKEIPFEEGESKLDHFKRAVGNNLRIYVIKYSFQDLSPIIEIEKKAGEFKKKIEDLHKKIESLDPKIRSLVKDILILLINSSDIIISSCQRMVEFLSGGIFISLDEEVESLSKNLELVQNKIKEIKSLEMSEIYYQLVDFINSFNDLINIFRRAIGRYKRETWNLIFSGTLNEWEKMVSRIIDIEGKPAESPWMKERERYFSQYYDEIRDSLEKFLLTAGKRPSPVKKEGEKLGLYGENIEKINWITLCEKVSKPSFEIEILSSGEVFDLVNKLVNQKISPEIVVPVRVEASPEFLYLLEKKDKFSVLKSWEKELVNILGYPGSSLVDVFRKRRPLPVAIWRGEGGFIGFLIKERGRIVWLIEKFYRAETGGLEKTVGFETGEETDIPQKIRLEPIPTVPIFSKILDISAFAFILEEKSKRVETLAKFIKDHSELREMIKEEYYKLGPWNISFELVSSELGLKILGRLLEVLGTPDFKKEYRMFESKINNLNSKIKKYVSE